MPTTTLGALAGPAAPSGLADTAIVGGYVNNVRDTASQALTGLADAGVTVSVYDGATLLGTTTPDGGGAWSYTLGRLLDGPHTLTATATDALGHVSAPSSALTFKVDTRPPSQPGGLADAAISKGLVNAAHNTADQTLTGKTDAGALVAVFDDGTQIGTVKAGATGTWSFTLGELAEGAHKLTATATDIAGNTSAASDVLAFTVDTTAPGAPTGLADTKIIGGYVNAGHNLANQALTGKAEAYAFVSIYDGATKLGLVQAGGTGDWSFTLGKLAEGDHSLTAAAADKAGNIGASSAALAFTVDTQAPPAIVGFVQETTPGTLLLAGGTEPGAIITVSEDSTTLGATVTGQDASWGVTLQGLADRPHDLTVTAADAAGNKSTTTLKLYHGGSIVFVDGDIFLSGQSVSAGGTVSHNGDAAPSRLVTLVGDVDGLSGQAHGGDDILTLEHTSAPSVGGPAATAIGDALLITDYAAGGDDQVFAFSGFGPGSVATAIGDAVKLSGHAMGGDDTVDALGMALSVGIGDANTLTDYAHGGDDVVVLSGGGPSGSATAGYGDGETMGGHAVGGDDTVTAHTAYGDAETLTDYARGGDDLVAGRIDYPFFTSVLFGDGASLLGHAQGGDDTLVGTAYAPDVMWGDAATVAATATTGADLFVFHLDDREDEIMDFEPGKDRIELVGLGVPGFADLSTHFQTTPDGVLISFDPTDGAANSILVRGVTVAQLTAADFVFS